MSNELVVDSKESKEKAIEYLSSMGLSIPEKNKTQFIELASAFGLNPFKREIYAVGYGDKWNIITGYEVYLKRAERIGKLDGWNVTVDGSGETMSATITIYRKDWKMPFSHTVLFSECCQKTKDKSTGEDKLNSVWAKMPSFMLKKVAIAQGFRLCFPDEFGGMPYTSDEMPSEEDMRNVTPPSAPVTETVSPSPKKSNTSSKKYTPEQAQELGTILTQLKADGTPIFTEEEKNTYREMLVSGNFEHAKEDATSILQKRLAAIVESELVDAQEPLF